MVNNCPNTRLVLGGYSQGAAVIDVISAVPVPGIGFNTPLPPNVPDHVAAIAVFGNPSAKLGLPAHGRARSGAAGRSTCATPATRSAPTAKRRRAPRVRGRAGQPGGRIRRGSAVAARFTAHRERVNFFRLVSVW